MSSQVSIYIARLRGRDSARMLASLTVALRGKLESTVTRFRVCNNKITVSVVSESL